MQRIIISFCLLFSITLQAGDFSAYVNDKGDISLPADFRKTMSHLGSWFVPQGDASGFHDVYTESKTIEVFRKTSEFADGATIVKELRAHASGSFTTGNNVSYANQDLKQWFVMIKDTKGRFEENPLWGDGWGWALFKPGDTSVNLAKDYKTDCLGCHIPAKNTDWVYTQAYPSLLKP